MVMSRTAFKLTTGYTPQGDQPAAIDSLVKGLDEGRKHQVLLGVTGSGKTFTMANVIAQSEKPTLILAPNKTLAAQLYDEMTQLFPENAVEYFVSYYDYYQPEAYLPTTDTYIEKDASRNDLIDRLRLSATRSLLTRSDVIVVASVSCIYGIGRPDTYQSMELVLREGDQWELRTLLRTLVEMQYERNDDAFGRGTFRVRGDTIDIFPAYEDSSAIRLSMFGDVIEEIDVIHPLSHEKIQHAPVCVIYPATHYAATYGIITNAIQHIEKDLITRVDDLKQKGKMLEAARLEQRVQFDVEMMREMGFCSGIENYSRYLDGRSPGEPPYTLMDYFPRDFLMIIDESHISVPQIGGMYKGDKSRKSILVDYGFRLPAAMDNRPLQFEEFEQKVGQTIYVSATPGPYELKEAEDEAKKHGPRVVEQLIRPTGLIDPKVEVRDADTQVKDVIKEVELRVKAEERVLITVLTKRMAEDLTRYMKDEGVRCRYLHSEIDTPERIEIIRALRAGEFDVLIGINLLREGLDLPEVSLVAIFDADRVGFLRSERSLIQTIGRAARNVRGKAILYARKETDAMKTAIEETARRREKQKKYNEEHNITPQTIVKSLDSVLNSIFEADYVDITNDPIDQMFRDRMRGGDSPAKRKGRKIKRKARKRRKNSRGE